LTKYIWNYTVPHNWNDIVPDKPEDHHTVRASLKAVPEASAATPTQQRLQELRALADYAPARAQVEAWQWIKALGDSDDQPVLAELFGLGRPESPRTRTLGMPVGPMRNVPGGPLINFILGIDCPWTGKTFHADGSGGINRVKPWSWPIVAALLPGNQRKRVGAEIESFGFRTTIKRGGVAPAVDVMAIEYDAPEFDNPAYLKRVLDELVEILPNTYLGRATWRRKDGGYDLVGYFALQRPVMGA
jgi:hypothetical protein